MKLECLGRASKLYGNLCSKKAKSEEDFFLHLGSQTYQATVFRRTLSGLLGSLLMNNFKPVPGAFLYFVLLYMQFHGVLHNKEAMPCFDRKPETIFQDSML